MFALERWPTARATNLEVSPKERALLKSISWNFVGWVDLEDVGFEGTPIDARHHTKEFLATAYGSFEKMARTMDPLGYDALFATEHHFQPEGIEVFPNLQLLGIHLAGITKNLRFGTAVNILPQWHPLRLAEDYAMADILTRGRVIFGVGRGTQTREAECLGAPMSDQRANRALMADNLELLMKAFNEEHFSHYSENYNIPPRDSYYRGKLMDQITLVPKPLYNKEIWQPISTGNAQGVELQARYGIKGIHPLIKIDGDEIDPICLMYQEAARKFGKDLGVGENMAAYLYCHMAESREKATAEVEIFEEESFKRQAGIGGLPTDPSFQGRFMHSVEDLMALGHPSTARATAKKMGYKPLAERAKDNSALLYGTADEIIASLKRLEEKYPALETLILHPPELTHSGIMLEQMERFAKEVMPAFPAAVQKDRVWPDLLANPEKIERYVYEPVVEAAE
ncbi:LLM class flavin-dependent oxidoreductase [Novosphingobium malaysiense]|uniref:LLM class flavin-dependent oxidoreductase n=1 Tax=Novosphingobium malaysiense TaxID=1348853 RepID=UPI0018CEC06B|nr:LLM class flavin-dependent oxidoreductase [Novosphingobium malaysiense]